MRDRLGEFQLSLHPDKTRLIGFGRFAATDRKRRGLGKPETFAFLGFTFICGLSGDGKFQLQRKTRRDRMRAKLKDIKVELRCRMHQPIPEQGRWLRQVKAGRFAYYAVPTNSRALSALRHYVTDRWRRTLQRQSQRDGFIWERMTKLVNDWLPPPRILHPWPDVRFDVKHPRSEPDALIGRVLDLCGGRPVMAVPTAIREDSPEIERDRSHRPYRSKGKAESLVAPTRAAWVLPGFVPPACNQRGQREQGRSIRFKRKLVGPAKPMR